MGVIHCISTLMPDTDTIAAIATPPGMGGVGVIRLSGPQVRQVLKNLWISGAKSVDNFLTHRLYYGKFKLFSTNEAVDSGMAVWMRAPHSYTGEDVVEIQVHGSPIILDRILESCLQGGARLAEPGEFTKRAYLNGKLDLAQAEAVADLIAASSEAGLKQAREHFSGALSKRILEFQEELTKLRAFVEATIDFPEDDIEMIQCEGILNRLMPIESGLESLALTYHEGRLLREGVQTVIVGRPNVGKSSLMNALLGDDRAIVHEEAGTTRDTIEENFSFGGFVFRLVDTAGLRKTADVVEGLGVSRSEKMMERGDLLLWVVDASSPITDRDADFLSKLDLAKTLICANKIDLGVGWNPDSLVLEQDRGQLTYLSAKTEEGLAELKEKMVEWVKKSAPHEGEGLKLTRKRHLEAIREALMELKRGRNILDCHPQAELVALHLRKAHEALGRITGTHINEALLEMIFREFCIGK